MWVESEEFKGSTFFFTARFDNRKDQGAPAAIEEPSEVEAAPHVPQSGEEGVKELSILLAEDNVVNQKMAQRMLEKRGWKVMAANNGQEVLDLLSKGKFDLILMDAQMPLLDGFAATKMIREKEAGTSEHIPIIALTARAMTADKKKCLDSGMDGHVSKPIDRQKLYEAIENFFRKGNPNDQKSD